MPAKSLTTVRAPVNCGYDATDYKYGRLYQWGRKYGQGYDSSDADYPGKSGGIQSLEDISTSGVLESHPDGIDYNGKFYKGWHRYSWYGGTDKDELWGATKTSYDPCPAGWRVPTYTELNDLFGDNSEPSFVTVGGQNGCYFNGTPSASSGVFLPAAGYRGLNEGAAFNRGGEGDYRSSSADDDTWSFFLCFSNEYAGVDSFRRAAGCSVRCVQE